MKQHRTFSAGTRRSGLSLINLLVVIAIIAIIGLFLSAIQKVQQAADLVEEQNQLRQIGLGCQRFQDTPRSLPGWGRFRRDSTTMGRLYQPLLFVLARCTWNELIRPVEWLKAENEMLRKRIEKKRIFLCLEEKARLMELGQAIGPALKHLITIVTYNTDLGWLRKGQAGQTPKKMGRLRTADSIRQLIVRIGTETGWGYTRVMGEIKKSA